MISTLNQKESKLISGGEQSYPVTIDSAKVTVGDNGVYHSGAVSGHIPVTDNITVHPYASANSNDGITGYGVYVTIAFDVPRPYNGN